MRVLLVLTLVLGSTPVSAQECPDVAPDSGYPVAAVSDAPVGAPWLSSVAAAVAYRWRVPSLRRNAYAGWERVQDRLLPPEPRWADEWAPDERHRAVISIVMYRDGRDPTGTVVEESGDEHFDRSLMNAVFEPMPSSPSFPPTPPTLSGDSIMVRVHLGLVPEALAVGVVRFAAVQTPVEVRRNSLRIGVTSRGRGRTPRVTVKYDVTPLGSVDRGSIEFLGAASFDLQAAIREGLMAARFTPATSNCRAIAQTVVQVFGR